MPRSTFVCVRSLPALPDLAGGEDSDILRALEAVDCPRELDGDRSGERDRAGDLGGVPDRENNSCVARARLANSMMSIVVFMLYLIPFQFLVLSSRLI